MWFARKKISSATLHLFTHQLATLLNAGLPLVRGLEILAAQETDLFFKKVILQLVVSIQNGNSLSEALASFPYLFSSFYLNMVCAGEVGGMLGMALSRVAMTQEKLQKVKKKTTSILLYPAMVLVMTLVMMIFLFLMIIPKFELVFAELLQQQQLPALTEALLQTSRYARTHVLEIGSLIIGFCVAGKIAWRLEPLRKALDRLLLQLFFFGPLLQKYFIAHSFYTLGTLMQHGVPILQAVEITQKISNNRVVQSAMMTLHECLRAGDSFLEPLQANRIFPPMVKSMVAVGEETGQLPEMLLQIATIYEEEVDHRIAQFLTLLEPCIILLLACFVGTIVMALFLPLMTMMSELQSP